MARFSRQYKIAGGFNQSETGQLSPAYFSHTTSDQPWRTQ
ncbi:hypothetical protein YPPY66_2316 [Yersinia pestis PY-66]|uniref:Uncharacterized protein n=2 Tax=Yersinia pestis TaxID=632 RepID=A0AAV3BE57_YERPE|nr:hypothetical protein YPIP275_2165 [Yersinia pestis biovar Orientalis str. IP275]EDR37328.1 hypothetical protein YpF1991016_4271 [Yersinia pestis biovar Orientalis str. F1991016]EDR42570.1 hypothetical protein YpE1979001_4313 [Yersinia pestis biovar Antiqua str. E1979001]EDR52276.1 hypothetical protein YpB42003004_1163 [Yersinia pestis biovar Antiqua str. B42003004]EDR57871.1 hypothetical protein YpMG051020_3663 [Yersinia pestis biovar Orientalis str. MG05-1020]EDR60949.1 hypothetical protei